jgi:tellurite methyltransferase
MDKNYWESYYTKQNRELIPSLFAQYVKKNYINDKTSLVELGCGNGRDAIFFAESKIQVLAIDQVQSEIEFLQHRFEKLYNIKFLQADFTALNNDLKFDIVYSRFTLHSISSVEEKRVLQWAYNNLLKNGVFCIEVRGQKNEIYKLGEPVVNDPDAYIYDGHYRRFLNFDVLCNNLITIGFSLDLAKEEKGFAPYNNDDETYIRVIAKKS